MAIKQITVFVENRRGGLVEITRLLAENSIDMRAMSIADTQDFGILRLIVDETEKALAVLTQNGVIAKTTDVTAVELSDRPGALSNVLSALDAAEINIEYLYAFLNATPGTADLVLRVADNAAAERVLSDAGYKLL